MLNFSSNLNVIDVVGVIICFWFVLQIRKLPGVEYNTEEQLRQLDILRNQLRLKRELLHKYRNLCTFEIPKA